MHATHGTYVNPVTRHCFVMCSSCFRCEKRGSSACPKMDKCSGVPDKEGIRVPHPDHYCQCKEGIMRWVTKKEALIIRRYESDPFAKNVQTDAKTQDERDWDAFITEKRENMGDELWDPLVLEDGTPVSEWAKRAAGIE